jgi:hypothetical protein
VDPSDRHVKAIDEFGTVRDLSIGSIEQLDIVIISQPVDWPAALPNGRIPLDNAIYAIEPGLPPSDYRFQILPGASPAICGPANLRGVLATSFTDEPVFISDETVAGAFLRFTNMVVIALDPSVQFFGFTDVGERRATLALEDTVLVGGNVGDARNFDFVTLDKLAMVDCGQGFGISNVGQVIVSPAQWGSGKNQVGSAFNFSGVVNTVEMLGGFYNMASNESMVDIDPGITTDFIDIVNANKTGAGSFYAPGSLTFTDPRVFVDSRGSGDSKVLGFGSLQLNASPAPITDVTALPVRINTISGAAQVEAGQDNQRAEVNTDGTVKMVNIDPVGGGTVEFVIGFSKASAGSDDFEFKIRKQTNSTGPFVDVPLSNIVKTFAGSGDKDVVIKSTATWNEVGNQDSFEVVVTGIGTTNDLTTKTFIVTIRE